MNELLSNGIFVFPVSNQFCVKKEEIEQLFSSYEEALDYANSILKPPVISNYLAIVRYNRGLGIEYKNLPIIQAFSLEEAQRIAANIAEKTLEGADIREIKVRFKNREECINILDHFL